MTHSPKHYSEAKMDRWEKNHVSNGKRARISSKRFNKAERKAVNQSLKSHNLNA